MLTSVGEEEFRRAGRIHLRGIDAHVGAHLTSDELAELGTLLAKLSEGVGGEALSILEPAEATT